MIDRNVEFPNRFRMTKVEGTDDIYDLIPAPGEVIAPGDTFSKGNMLPDEIVSLLGLKMANPQVKDALNVLAHVGNLHVWERVQTYSEPVPEVPAGYTLGEVEENVTLVSLKSGMSTGNTFYVYTSDSVLVDNYGVVTLESPQSSRYSIYEWAVSYYTLLRGKFCLISPDLSSSTFENHFPNEVFFIPSDAMSTDGSGQKFEYTKLQRVTGYPYTPAIPAGTHVDYLTSTDRNAYPDQSAEGGQDASYVLGDVVTSEVYLGRSGASNLATINVSDSISVSDDGTITQTNPQIVTIGYGGTINYEKDELTTLIAGKFLKFVGKGDIPEDMPMLDIGNLYYIPSSVTVTFKDPTNEGMEYHSIDKYQPVTGHAAIPANTTITYLGQLGGGARIEVGSYVGTGTYGSSNPCSVSASFPIKRLSVFGEIYANTGKYFPIYLASGYSSYSMHDILLTTSFASRRGIHKGTSNYSLDYSFGKKSVDGRTFSWYSSGNAASFQLNESGSIYYYIAIG